MNKKKGVKKLGKPADERVALIKSQVKDLIERDYIKTTKPRAKQVIRKLDQLMSFVQNKNIKKVSEYLNNRNLETKLQKLNFGERKTGFTNLIEIKNRAGDNAELVLIELLKV